MDYHEILDILAPCGLNCRKCFNYIKGDIAFHSKKVQELLGNFDVYAERFSVFKPEFKDYPQFKKLLAYLASPECIGSRKGKCKFPNCGVADCYKEKGVDFCFQCDEFPCDKTNFDPHLKKRWLQMNNRMKEIGVEAYYEETKNMCRYL
ncbi:MAG: DUF3795 domain-containing protein [Planctomycetota bacterium]|jgi:hypothetical protein